MGFFDSRRPAWLRSERLLEQGRCDAGWPTHLSRWCGTQPILLQRQRPDVAGFRCPCDPRDVSRRPPLRVLGAARRDVPAAEREVLRRGRGAGARGGEPAHGRNLRGERRPGLQEGQDGLPAAAERQGVDHPLRLRGARVSGRHEPLRQALRGGLRLHAVVLAFVPLLAVSQGCGGRPGALGHQGRPRSERRIPARHLRAVLQGRESGLRRAAGADSHGLRVPRLVNGRHGRHARLRHRSGAAAGDSPQGRMGGERLHGAIHCEWWIRDDGGPTFRVRYATGALSQRIHTDGPFFLRLGDERERNRRQHGRAGCQEHDRDSRQRAETICGLDSDHVFGEVQCERRLGDDGEPELPIRDGTGADGQRLHAHGLLLHRLGDKRDRREGLQ